MNQQDIDQYLDNIISTAEKGIDRSFAATLKDILNEIAAMYQKYANGDGTLTWTDMNKFNRLQQEMTMISGAISKQYADVLNQLQSMTQTVYLENFMRSSYLYELAAQTPLGVSVPSTADIAEAVKNPIDKLTLPALMQSHQSEIINKLHISISQSLMAGEGYALMARRIQQAVGFSQAKARNVARTEGGRIQTQARLDSAEQAAKHADLQKVWMSTLDLRTRPDHRKLDGQEADKDGYFHIHEFKAKGPHLFGVAKEDCNCRCTVVMKVNGILPDTRNAHDYKDAGYQQKLADRMDRLMADGMTQNQAEKQAKKEIQPPSVKVPFTSYDEWLSGKKAVKSMPKTKVNLEISNFPADFVTKSEAKNTQKLIDFVNNLPDADPNVVKLYGSMGKMESIVSNGIPFKISHAKNHALTASYRYGGDLTDVKLTIPKLKGDDLRGQIGTTLHEEMHLMDLYNRKDPSNWFSTEQASLVNAFKRTDYSMSKDIKDLFKKYNAEQEKIHDERYDSYREQISSLKEQYLGENGRTFKAYKEYDKKAKKLLAKTAEDIDYASRNAMGGGVDNLQDIYDALSKGSYRDKHIVKYGHGGEYYASADKQIHETVANYAALSVTRPDLIKLLKADKPELVAELDKFVQAMLKKVGE